MGRLARPASGGITKYYWYPGERSDWLRAAIAAGTGLVAIIVVSATTGSGLAAAVTGASVTALVAGFTYGRKDASALETFSRFAAGDTARAAWRALVKGCGAALAAVLVVHSAQGAGFAAGWLLPLVPVIAGSLAHQGGMLFERVSQARSERAAVLVSPVAPAVMATAAPRAAAAQAVPAIAEPTMSDLATAMASNEGRSDPEAHDAADARNAHDDRDDHEARDARDEHDAHHAHHGRADHEARDTHADHQARDAHADHQARDAHADHEAVDQAHTETELVGATRTGSTA